MKVQYDQRRRVLWLEATENTTYGIRNALRGLGGIYEKGRWVFPARLAVFRRLRDGLPGLLSEIGYGTVGVTADRWEIAENDRQGLLDRLRNGNPPEGHFLSRTKPYGFQVHGSTWLYRNDGCLFFDDMGLGKTKQAIDAAHATLQQDPRIVPLIMIVCPNGLKYNWKREIEKHALSFDRGILIPSGRTVERAEQLRTCRFKAEMNMDDRRPVWVIINYEALRYFLFEWHQTVEDAILICDEAHRLKNGRTQVTKAVDAAKPARIWLMTGTPVWNRLEDVWSLANLVRPGVLGWTWFQFERRHIIRESKFNRIVNYKNPERVRQVLGEISLGRKKEEVLDLPEKVYARRYVELSPEERRAYDRMRRDLVTWLDELPPGEEPTIVHVNDFSVRFLRLRQIADGMVSQGADEEPNWSRARSKIAELQEIYKDLDTERMVVWVRWVPVGRMAATMLSHALKRPVACIDGDVPLEDREKLIADWKEHGGPLVLQMAVGGVGLNLQEAFVEVFLDPPTTPGERRQCEDRLHRIGQTKTVTVIDLIARGTTDEPMLDMLEEKMRAADDVTSGSFVSYGLQDQWRRLVG